MASDDEILVVTEKKGNGRIRKARIKKNQAMIVFPKPRRVQHNEQEVLIDIARQHLSSLRKLNLDDKVPITERVKLNDRFTPRTRFTPAEKARATAPPKKLKAVPYRPNQERIIVTSDISMGMEEVAVPMVIDVEGVRDEEIEGLTPKPFTYTNTNIMAVERADLSDEEDTDDMFEPFRCDCPPGGCDNLGAAENKESECACRRRPSTLIRTRTGSLLHIPRPEEETFLCMCGPACACRGRCYNALRPSLRYRLELVCHTRKLGFGVRTLVNIPPGAPVMEYVGEIITEDQLLERSARDPRHKAYSMLLSYGHDEREKKGLRWPFDRVRWNGRAVSRAKADLLEYPPLFIDALRAGNVARFINHSCLPNCYIAVVQSNERSPAALRILVVSNEPIPAGSELFLDYGSLHDSARGCLCGGPICTSNPLMATVDFRFNTEKQNTKLLSDYVESQRVRFNRVIDRAIEAEEADKKEKRREKKRKHEKISKDVVELMVDDDDDIICLD